MRVVVAPDSFKGTIGAADAAAALAAGWRAARPGDEVTCLPLADGGEGTVAVLAAASAGARWHEARVSGPGAGPVTARWLELPGQLHVIELASAAGLPQLAVPDPLGAHTAGVGELLGRALDAGARRIVLGLGGSASTDGGTGALAALGARFLDAGQRELPRGGGALARLASADLSGLRPPPPDGVACLTDVRAPLLGPNGAAVVFGPQKGATAGQVIELEAGPGQAGRRARRRARRSPAPARPAAPATGWPPPGAPSCAPARPRSPGSPAWTPRWPGRAWSSPARAATTRPPPPARWSGPWSPPPARAGVPAALVAGAIGGPPVPAIRRAVALAELAGGAAAAMAEPDRWLRQAGRELAGWALPAPARTPSLSTCER